MTMRKTYGWYYEGGSVQGQSDDFWDLLGRAIETAADDERLPALRFGEMCDLSVEDLISTEDVIEMAQEGALTADALVEVISERASERVEEGHAWFDSATAKPAFRRVVQAHTSEFNGAPDVIAWATEHVALDPSRFCDGRQPLPIEWIEGEWRYGCRDLEPAPTVAMITYTTAPSPETGDAGWCWWVLGQMGESRSLTDALAQANRRIRLAIEGAE